MDAFKFQLKSSLCSTFFLSEAAATLLRQCSATQYCFFACGVPVVPLQRVDIISLDVYNSLKWTYKIMIHLYSILRKFKMFISSVIFENFPSFMTCLVNITSISGIPKNAWKTRRNIGNFAHRFAQPIKSEWFFDKTMKSDLTYNHIF